MEHSLLRRSREAKASSIPAPVIGIDNVYDHQFLSHLSQSHEYHYGNPFRHADASELPKINSLTMFSRSFFLMSELMPIDRPALLFTIETGFNLGQ